MFFLSLLIFAGMQFLEAQTYHPLVANGKIWTTYHSMFLWEPPTSDYTKFERDTTIGSITYKRVWVATDAAMTQWQDYGIIREDAQKRVFYSFTEPAFEYLLYDFNSAAGDTLYLHGNISPYVLDSLGTYTLVTGEQRKKFMLHYTGYDCSETWVEGIGCITYGILNGGFCGLVGDNPKMICGWENDTIKYHWIQYPDCFIFTGINNLSQNGQTITVFPNPASDAITVEIKTGITGSLHIEIMDLTGRIFYKQELSPTTSVIPLDDNTIPAGLYLYRIVSGKETLSTGKLTIL